mmetsp:Transcript_9580/g.26476  ORF Transcript_9580/g.26476 Transcript_9580/m.26476 type:complete len:111 (+) Transcript_9580:323-655(+)
MDLSGWYFPATPVPLTWSRCKMRPTLPAPSWGTARNSVSVVAWKSVRKKGRKLLQFSFVMVVFGNRLQELSGQGRWTTSVSLSLSGGFVAFFEFGNLQRSRFYTCLQQML